MKRNLAAGWAAFVLLAACDHPDDGVSNLPSPISTTPDTSTEEAECTLGFEELQLDANCPPSFDPAGDRAAQLCRSEDDSVAVSSWDQRVGVIYSIGGGGTECIYEDAGHQLIGVVMGDDVARYCNYTSAIIWAGEHEWPADVDQTGVDCQPAAASPDAGSP